MAHSGHSSVFTKFEMVIYTNTAKCAPPVARKHTQVTETLPFVKISNFLKSKMASTFLSCGGALLRKG